jgi:hypothetical protein
MAGKMPTESVAVACRFADAPWIAKRLDGSRLGAPERIYRKPRNEVASVPGSSGGADIELFGDR